MRGLTYLAQSLSCIQISRATSPARIRVSSYHCARLQASTFERIRIIAYDLSITNSSPFESLSDQSLTHSSEFKYPTRSLLSKFESPTRFLPPAFERTRISRAISPSPASTFPLAFERLKLLRLRRPLSLIWAE